MATETFSTANCEGCACGTIVCGVCIDEVSVIADITLPTMVTPDPAVFDCYVCETLSGSTVPGLSTGEGATSCCWEYSAICESETGNELVFAQFCIQQFGDDVLASLIVQVTKTIGGGPGFTQSERHWQKIIGAWPINCDGLSVSFDAGDLTFSEDGPCILSDSASVQL